MTNFDVLKNKLLQDPDFKAEYDRLEPEYMLAEALIQARIERKITQTELAHEVGISQVMIARLESGSSNPTLSTISRVARALGKELKLTSNNL